MYGVGAASDNWVSGKKQKQIKRVQRIRKVRAKETSNSRWKGNAIKMGLVCRGKNAEQERKYSSLFPFAPRSGEIRLGEILCFLLLACYVFLVREKV